MKRRIESLNDIKGTDFIMLQCNKHNVLVKHYDDNVFQEKKFVPP